jgi:hypothetical protein
MKYARLVIANLVFLLHQEPLSGHSNRGDDLTYCPGNSCNNPMKCHSEGAQRVKNPSTAWG